MKTLIISAMAASLVAASGAAWADPPPNFAGQSHYGHAYPGRHHHGWRRVRVCVWRFHHGQRYRVCHWRWVPARP